MSNVATNESPRAGSNISPELLAKRTFFRRKKGCPLSEPGAPVVDYKDIKLLSRFLSERGRLLPSRITGVCAKKQRELKKAVKQARNIALLPFVLQ